MSARQYPVLNPTEPLSDERGRVTKRWYDYLTQTNLSLNDLLKGKLNNAFTVSTLPASPTVGMQVYVSDSNTNVWGATIASTGSNKVLAWYNGTNWTVIGK